jgi:hypothetical protein
VQNINQKIYWFLIVFGLSLICAPVAQAATYYIAPNGSNSNDGKSPSAPFQTFSHAFNSARCGSTLILLDGTYGDGTRTGKLHLRNAKCTAGNELTIKSQNQRRAKIVDDGTNRAVFIEGSSYITVDGLHARSTNKKMEKLGLGVPFGVSKSNHITFRNNLANNPNKHNNTPVFSVLFSQDILFEDNEGYDFHRHCATGWQSERVIVRRLYCNPQEGGLRDGLGRPAAAGSTERLPPPSWDIGSGDGLFSMYPCKDCILENSIADGKMFLNEMNATYGDQILMSGSKVLGSICVNCTYGNGMHMNPRKAADLNHTPQNILIENVAIVDHKSTGSAIRASDVVNLVVQNVTMISAGGPTGLTLDDTNDGATPAQESATVRDTVVRGFSGTGFNKEAASYNSLTTSNLYSFDNGTAARGNWGNVNTSDPGMGSCKVFIPDGSPLKGKGTNGSDIGANILCRYENGVLTQTQLWNWQTGQFPCGAVIQGVNDNPADSCIGVHMRLNVNTNGCKLPATPSCKQPAPPNFPPIPPGWFPPGGSSFPPLLGPNGEVCYSGF